MHFCRLSLMILDFLIKFFNFTNISSNSLTISPVSGISSLEGKTVTIPFKDEETKADNLGELYDSAELDLVKEDGSRNWHH